MRAPWVSCVVVAVATASCTALFSLGDLSDSRTDAASNDAPTDSPRPVDVTEAPDTSSDSGAPGDAAARSLCPGHPNAIFCDDFDDGSFGAKWDATLVSSWTGAALSLSDAQARSPPYSLLAQLQPDAATSWAFATLNAYAGAVPAKLRASFDLYVEELADHTAEIPFVSLQDGLNAYVFYLYLQPNGTSPIVNLGEDLADGGQNIYTIGQAAQIVGQWVRAVLDLDLGASPTFTLTVEQPPGTPSTPIAQAIPIAFGAATLVAPAAGLYGILTPARCTYYVDNVLIETE